MMGDLILLVLVIAAIRLCAWLWAQSFRMPPGYAIETHTGSFYDRVVLYDPEGNRVAEHLHTVYAYPEIVRRLTRSANAHYRANGGT